MSSSHNDDDDDDRPIQPAQHRRRLVTQTGGSSDGGTGETTSASGRLGSLLKGVSPGKGNQSSSSAAATTGITRPKKPGEKPKFAPRKGAHQPRKAAAESTAETEDEPGTDEKPDGNKNQQEKTQSEHGKKTRKLQKRKEKHTTSTSQQSGRVTFSAKASSEEPVSKRKSSLRSERSSDQSEDREKASSRTRPQAKNVSFSQEGGETEAQSRVDEVKAEEHGVEEEEENAGEDVWPPSFSDPEAPVALPLERVEGDPFLLDRDNGSSQEERKLAQAEKETAEAILSEDLAEKAGIIGLGLTSDVRAVENAAGALCGSDFAPTTNDQSSSAVHDGDLMMFQFPSRLPFAPQTEIANKYVGKGSGSNDTPLADESLTVKLEEEEEPNDEENEVPQDVKDSRELAQRRLDPFHLSESMKQIPEGKIGKMHVYRSGKVTLDIGGIEFDITASQAVRHHQQIVEIDASEEQMDEDGHSSGRYVELGNVPRRYIATPNVEKLLHQWSTSDEPASDGSSGVQLLSAAEGVSVSENHDHSEEDVIMESNSQSKRQVKVKKEKKR